jgi:putative ABC transport system permease protein
VEIGPILRAMARSKTKVALLVLEIAFTTAVVLNCLAMIVAQRDRVSRPSGLDEANLLTIAIRPWGEAFQEVGFRRELVTRDLAALRALPGVADATRIGPFPLQGGGSSSLFKPEGAPDSAKVRAPVYGTDPRTLSTLGLELVSGRGLEEGDMPETTGPQPLNCLITQDLAESLFPGEPAAGKLIRSGGPFAATVVGVVRRMVTPYGGGPMESRIVLTPAGPPSETFMSYMVRVRPGELDRVFGALSGALLGVEPARVVEVQALADVKTGGYAFNLFLARALETIALLLLAVTALGVFGVTSFSVTQRTKQIGTRRALGASRGAILRHFLIENTLITAMGTSLGLLGAFALNVLLVTRFDGTRLGIGLIAAGLLVVWLVGVAATAAPARRASLLSPALATRTV